MSNPISHSLHHNTPFAKLMHAMAYLVGSCKASVVSAFAKEATLSCSNSFLSRKHN